MKVYSREALAEKLGITRQAVDRYVRDGRWVPDVQDANGTARWFSEDAVARIVSERKARLKK